MPSARIPQYANDFNKDDLLGAFLALKENINRNLHVATLCTIDCVIDESFRIVRCTAFPRRQGKNSITINAICIDKADFEKIEDALNRHGKPIALAILTDYDSEANYKRIMQTNVVEQAETTSSMHSYNNAVIVKVGDAIGAEEEE